MTGTWAARHQQVFCGARSLDVWLREQALPASARRTARTWVWIDRQAEVVGYYALTAHKVAREKVPTKVGRGGPTEIPAVLLARLALPCPRLVVARGWIRFSSPTRLPAESMLRKPSARGWSSWTRYTRSLSASTNLSDFAECRAASCLCRRLLTSRPRWYGRTEMSNASFARSLDAARGELLDCPHWGSQPGIPTMATGQPQPVPSPTTRPTGSEALLPTPSGSRHYFRPCPRGGLHVHI